MVARLRCRPLARSCLETEQQISLKKLELEGAKGRKAQEIRRELKRLRDDADALCHKHLKVADPKEDQEDPTKPTIKLDKDKDKDADKEADRQQRIAEASADRVRSLEQQTLLASALTAEERTQFERQIAIANILENKRGLTDEQLKAELEATSFSYEQLDLTKQIKDANVKKGLGRKRS